MFKIALVALLSLSSLVAHGYSQKDVDKALKTGSCPGCDLQAADLTFLKCRSGNFSGAKLAWSDLRFAECANSTFSNADMTGSIARMSNFNGASFSAANLSNAELSSSKLVGTDFSGANTLGVGFYNANLFDATITQKQLNNAKTIRGAILPEGGRG